MKILEFLKSFVIPQQMLKYKSISTIVSICIFVIASFFLGIPVGQNKILRENDIRNNYNYNVLQEIPNRVDINNVISEVVSKECKVVEGKELKCDNLTDNLYVNHFEFEKDGIKKRVYLVIDIFDIPTVYIDDVKINYPPLENFTTDKFPPEANTEDYLVILSSDSLYFQAHPFGTDNLRINHNGHILKTNVMKIYYQNNIPDFAFSMDNPESNGYQIGDYLTQQLIIGNANTLKLKSFTQAFLLGVLFTFITVVILWVYFRKWGKLKKFSDYYHIAAINNLSVALVFFILLWFIPRLLNLYIFAFALYYIITIYIINTTEDLA